MNNVIVENISKSYKKAGTSGNTPIDKIKNARSRKKGLNAASNEIKALDKVSFRVDSGELFGFIGPDGAGKTSLFRILVSLLLPDSGTATVCGFDVVKDFKKIRNIAGYMPGKFSLYQDLTVEENLTFFATIFGTTIQKNYHLIKDIYCQIEPFKDRRAGALSGGMKQKLALSCAMIHKPEILFLDEPTTGVDAVSRMEFWEMLHNLKKAGITIIVSTPYMDEASLCDRVALIQEGSILKIGTPEEIITDFQKPVFAIRSENTHQLIRDLEKSPECESVYPFGQYLHFIPENVNIVIDTLSKTIHESHPEAEVFQVKPDIEDCFINLMKEKK
ncbi:MAG TPA: ABC transporter ATP-binding protein [Bacteroidales bacterium]|nr:ABC transporter ATP-binding protein [Bacteroidales bacterium]HPI30879.1 ABC transporter ATP-binding protein [Bacteroidales bacterium]HQN17157.1 ABC transporter ATP-binding protein [Bacteroidales bacterium]